MPQWRQPTSQLVSLKVADSISPTATMIDTNTSFAALAVTDQPPTSNTIQDELQERSLLILYASETGNSQDIAEELGRMARRLHFHTDVEEMNDVTTNMVSRCSV